MGRWRGYSTRYAFPPFIKPSLLKSVSVPGFARHEQDQHKDAAHRHASEGGGPHGPTSTGPATEAQGLLREGEGVSSRKEVPHRLSNPKWLAQEICTSKQYQTDLIGSINAFVCVCVTIIKSINWDCEGAWEELARRRGDGDGVFLYDVQTTRTQPQPSREEATEKKQHLHSKNKDWIGRGPDYKASRPNPRDPFLQQGSTSERSCKSGTKSPSMRAQEDISHSNHNTPRASIIATCCEINGIRRNKM